MTSKTELSFVCSLIRHLCFAAGVTEGHPLDATHQHLDHESRKILSSLESVLHLKANFALCVRDKRREQHFGLLWLSSVLCIEDKRLLHFKVMYNVLKDTTHHCCESHVSVYLYTVSFCRFKTTEWGLTSVLANSVSHVPAVNVQNCWHSHYDLTCILLGICGLFFFPH